MAELKYELWRNSIRGFVGVKKTDRRGEIVDEIVRGGEKLQISTEDRLLNSDLAANEDLDVFKNGYLTPVRLIDGTEDAAEIASNPNLITESEMGALFQAHWKTFEAKIGMIKNATTLQRLLALGEDEETGATVRQVTAIKNRMAELNPVQVVERQSIPPSSGEIRPSTP